MTLDALKEGWEKLPQQETSPKHIMSQISKKKQKVMHSVRRKLLSIPVLLIAAWFAWEAFDLALHPWEMIALVALAATAMLLNTLLFYHNASKAYQAESLLLSLEGLRRQFKQQSVLQPIIAALLNGSWMYAMLSSITWTNTKYLILAGMLATLLLFLYLSFAYWRKKEHYTDTLIASLQEA